MWCSCGLMDSWRLARALSSQVELALVRLLQPPHRPCPGSFPPVRHYTVLLVWDSRRLISGSIPVLETSSTFFAVPAFLSSSSPSADAPAALDPPTLSTDDNSQAAEEDDDDAPPPFPLPDSHQRSSAPSQTPLLPPPPPPTFSLTPADDQLRDPLADEDDEPLPRSRGKGKALATPTTTTKVIKTREKVVLEVGFSALDWSRVQRSGVWKDGPLRVRFLFSLPLSPTNSPSSCLALRSQHLTPKRLTLFLPWGARAGSQPPPAPNPSDPLPPSLPQRPNKGRRLDGHQREGLQHDPLRRISSGWGEGADAVCGEGRDEAL